MPALRMTSCSRPTPVLVVLADVRRPLRSSGDHLGIVRLERARADPPELYGPATSIPPPDQYRPDEPLTLLSWSLCACEGSAISFDTANLHPAQCGIERGVGARCASRSHTADRAETIR